MTADVLFWFDPVCPFAWMTSQWVREVARQRDYTVDWRFISLRLLNAHLDYATHFPPEYQAGHTAGLRLLRVAARTREEHGRPAVGRLYEAMGGRIWDTDQEVGTRAEPAVVAQVLLAAGLPIALATALDEDRWDSVLQRETDEALALTGRDVGRRSCSSDRRTAWPSSGRSSAGCRHPSRASSSGTTSSGWRRSAGSRSSSAACVSCPSCGRSASRWTRWA